MSDNFTNWERKNRLGSGTFGVVWRVVTDSGEVLAAKYFEKSEGPTMKVAGAAYEVQMLKQLSHTNIVKFVTLRQLENEQIVVFTEFIDGSDLAKLSPVRDQRKLQDYIKQICSGLNYMHTRNPPVLHRDLKGENIVVTRDGTVKLIDFGISINLMAASGVNVSQVLMTMTHSCGTLPFMAPELFVARCQFSVKSDVWALGITIYQMLAGKPPFCELGNARAIVDRITGQGAPVLPSGSEQLKNFYACCTAMQARDRKSVRELLLHPFLA